MGAVQAGPTTSEKSAIEYLWVVARPELGARIAVWERHPDHPGGEAIVEGAEAGVPLEPKRVARTSVINDKLHPEIAKGGTLRIVSGQELEKLCQDYDAYRAGGEERANATLVQRARGGDPLAATILAARSGRQEEIAQRRAEVLADELEGLRAERDTLASQLAEAQAKAAAPPPAKQGEKESGEKDTSGKGSPGKDPQKQ